MNKQQIAVGLFIFVVGLLTDSLILPRFIAPKNKPVSTVVSEKPAEDSGLKQKLQQLTDADIAEYYRLKTMEERYKKADEILGKIMQIFLADLGIRIAPETIENSKRALLEPTLAPPPPPTATIAVKNAPVVPNWKQAEKAIQNVKDNQDIKEFLEKVKIDNFEEESRKSTNYTNKSHSIEALNGSFLGNARVFSDKKYQRWDVEMLIAAQFVNGTLNGRANIIMSKDGKPFSRQRGSGDLKGVREFESGSEAILVEASPSTYFQLYYIRAQDAFVGNIYDRNTAAEPFEYIGTVNLRRVN